MRVKLRLITKNGYKAREFQTLFAGTRYDVVPTAVSIEEIQTEDMEALVADKAIKAFDRIRRPLFVDHTGLYLELFDGFPAGLTEIFWERLRNDRLARIIGTSQTPAAIAVTLICYCDGRKLETFRGEVKGTISPEPRGPEGFQCDPVFIPIGHNKTFSEMGDHKNQISMRREATDKFIGYLNEHHR